MNKKLGIGIALLLIGTAAAWQFSKKDTVTAPDKSQHPGWVDHFRELKGDENGNIPTGLAMKWYKAD